MSEAELRERIHKLNEGVGAVAVEIAKLESRQRRLANQALITHDALRIARDKGLE